PTETVGVAVSGQDHEIARLHLVRGDDLDQTTRLGRRLRCGLRINLPRVVLVRLVRRRGSVGVGDGTDQDGQREHSGARVTSDFLFHDLFSELDKGDLVGTFPSSDRKSRGTRWLRPWYLS